MTIRNKYNIIICPVDGYSETQDEEGGKIVPKINTEAMSGLFFDCLKAAEEALIEAGLITETGEEMGTGDKALVVQLAIAGFNGLLNDQGAKLLK